MNVTLGIKDETGLLVSNFEFADKKVEDIMIPETKINTLITLNSKEIIKQYNNTKYSKLIITGLNNHPIGCPHIKDVIKTLTKPDQN